MRGLLGVAVTLMVMPGVALAQSPDRPVVELGAQGSKRISDEAPVAWALRLTVPLKRRAAIEVTADIQKSVEFEREFSGGTRTSAKKFSVHWRQTVFDQPAQSTPPPAGWQRVKPGREVWVTTNTGSLVHGDIVAISDSNLSIREQDREVTIRLDDVRLVEGRDSNKNGFLIGAVPGAVAGGLMGSAFGSFLCSGSTYCDDDAKPTAIIVGAVGGAAVGGLFGLMVDALIPGRQTLFGRSTIVVTPVITPNRKAIDVAIRWR